MAEIIVALLALAGTAIGSIAGILTANRLTNYRIEQLEKKVGEFNNISDRTYKLEEHKARTDDEIRRINHRLTNLEEGDDKK